MQLAAYPNDLEDKLNPETLSTRDADGSPRRLAPHSLAVAVVRAVKRESAFAFLHLVPELDVEPFPAHAAGLRHRGHRLRVVITARAFGPTNPDF
jgi:hypothetical protein